MLKYAILYLSRVGSMVVHIQWWYEALKSARLELSDERITLWLGTIKTISCLVWFTNEYYWVDLSSFYHLATLCHHLLLVGLLQDRKRIRVTFFLQWADKISFKHFFAVKLLVSTQNGNILYHKVQTRCLEFLPLACSLGSTELQMSYL